MGEWGTRLLTEDGGKTWQDHSLTIDEEHPQFVWLTVPDQEKVRQRREGVRGRHAERRLAACPRTASFCWIIGEFAYLFRTEDGGMN